MKKTFEFEQDDEFGDTILVADIIQSWINHWLTKKAKIKVTEIKPPAPMSVSKEYCECYKTLGFTYIIS